jgi:DNA polymerase-3 subunit beta
MKISINARQLVAANLFASKEQTRYYLNGIYMHAAEGRLIFVATDGHRLARHALEAPDEAAGMPGIIIPRKTVGEIATMAQAAGKAGHPMQISVSASKIRVEAGTLVMVSKLIDGTYPDYSRVIPVKNAKTAFVESAAFAAALDRVSTISSERGRAVKLAMAEGKITLSVKNPDAGDATDETPADYTGAPLEIGFNARYLADFLNALDADTVEMRLDEPGSPTLITNPADPAFTGVIMPMRV